MLHSTLSKTDQQRFASAEIKLLAKSPAICGIKIFIGMLISFLPGPPAFQSSSAILALFMQKLSA